MKVALAVDGLNLLKGALLLQKRPDLAMLLRLVSDNGKREVLFKHFYIGPPSESFPAAQHTALKQEIERMGYAWVRCESPGTRPGKAKSTVDVTIVMDMMTWAASGRVDVINLVSGDGDYTRVVHRVREMGVKVCLLGVTGNTSEALLHEIGASDFYDLDKIGVLRPR